MKLNANNLKNELWDTLLKLRKGEVEPEVAKVTAMAAREIIRVVNTEINLAVLTGRRPNKNLLTQRTS